MSTTCPPQRPRNQPAQSDAGLALVLVLWIVLAVALQITILSRGLRDGVRIGANEAKTAARDMLAHAAVETAVARLTTGDPRRRWQGNGQTHTLEFSAGRVTLRLHDDNGRINLNMAPANLLAAAFRAAGVTDAALAATLADRVIDWRDADDERQPRGAEAADYRRAGKRYGAANLPFLHVSDVGRVLGVTPEVSQRLANLVTVYGRSDKINLELAADPIWYALPDIDATTAARALAAKARGELQAMEAELTRAAPHLSNVRGPIYRLELSMQLDSTPTMNTEIVVAIGTDPAVPYHVLAWGTVAPRPVDRPGKAP
jgi:general secretion pathway protein K